MNRAELCAVVAEYRAECEAAEESDVDTLWRLTTTGRRWPFRIFDALTGPDVMLDAWAALSQYEEESGESVVELDRTRDPHNRRNPRPKE